MPDFLTGDSLTVLCFFIQIACCVAAFWWLWRHEKELKLHIRVINELRIRSLINSAHKPRGKKDASRI